MNFDLGKEYEDCICEDCKQRIIDETSKLNRRSLLRPRRVMNKFKDILCPKCLKAVQEKMLRK